MGGLFKSINKYFKNLKLKKTLRNNDFKDLKPLSFNGLETYAKIISVYDGDSVVIVFPYKMEFVKYSCRIAGIDAPELRNSGKREKELATKARDFLRSLILDKVVFVKFGKFDKYKRPLVDIIYKRKSIKDIMVNNKLAISYNGEKKSHKW